MVGAGPAGCAAAIALAAHAPSLDLVQVAPRAATCADLGECVPPGIELLLRRLGVWETFLRDGHRPSCRSDVAWGSPYLASNDRLFQVDRVAWRLHRRRFDAMLKDASAAAITVVDAEVTGADTDGRRVKLHLSNDSVLVARFAIDATGRRAVVAGALDGTVEHLDRLVAVTSSSASRDGLQDLTVESDPMGWWYATDRADGSHIIVRMSDADLIHDGGLRNPGAFAEDLRRTRHVGTETPIGCPAVHPASSRRMLSSVNAPVIAVGDAAWTQDPISGEGIVKALRSGFYAAYTAADFLMTSNHTFIERYSAFVTVAWSAYRHRWATHYRQEQRWPESAFWQRRLKPGLADSRTSRAALRGRQEGATV